MKVKQTVRMTFNEFLEPERCDQTRPDLILMRGGEYMIVFYSQKSGNPELYVTTSKHGLSWTERLQVAR